MKFFKYTLLLLLFADAWLMHAQLDEVYMAPPDYIRTAICTINDYPYITPIASLDDYIFISFDDLEADQKTYYYRIRHFNENWEASTLLPMEYIDGYDSDYIENESNSQATIRSYTHYELKIPNEKTKITKSGNYLIEILDEDEEPVFNFPLIVYENALSVSVEVKRPVEPGKLYTHQFVRFSLNVGNFPVQNPAGDFTVKVYKNENIFEPKKFSAPTFNLGNRLVYHFPSDALFPGGNEFNYFETRDLRGYNPGLDSMRLYEMYHAYVHPFPAVNYYMERKDINGSYVVDSFRADDKHTESDYIAVHFGLPADLFPQQEKIYVIGRFNNWQTDERARLKLNKNTGMYETVYLLKQGYYDYYYVSKNQDGTINWTGFQPSFSQTENRYTVVVYYHPPGARYTRVIGMGQAVSKPLK